MKDQLTVREFAAAAGVSRQRIYKLMVDSLQPYVVKAENGYTMLKSEGLAVFGKAAELTADTPLLTPDNSKEMQSGSETEADTPSQGVDTIQPDRVDSCQPSAIDSCQQAIDALTKQLDVKDSQIAALTEQIAALNSEKERLYTELHNAQALHAATAERLKLLEAKEPTESESSQNETDRGADHAQEVPAKKQSPLDWIKSKFRKSPPAS